MELDEFYSDLLLEYSNDTTYQEVIENPDFTEKILNPLCGDRVEISGIIKDGILEKVAYKADGCSISKASVAILCGLMKGKPVEKVKEVIATYEKMIIEGKTSKDTEGQLEDAQILKGVSKLPARQRCALIAWEGLKKVIEK